MPVAKLTELISNVKFLSCSVTGKRQQWMLSLMGVSVVASQKRKKILQINKKKGGEEKVKD